MHGILIRKFLAIISICRNFENLRRISSGPTQAKTNTVILVNERSNCHSKPRQNEYYRLWNTAFGQSSKDQVR
jgi:hypothetical protein